MKSPSTLKRDIDGVLMSVGNPADHTNIKATSRTTVYFLETSEKDGSSALMYDNGYTVGYWCQTKRLKSHLIENAHIMHKSKIIPEDWQIIDPDFFKSLAII